MRRSYQKAAFLLLFLLSFPRIAIAQVYEIETAGEYVMGDSDTKIDARKLALEHAKRLAIENIGTYLESETVVKNRLLTKDEIRTYTSAVIKTTVLSENISLLEDKTTVFKIRIRANVDIGVLEKKMREIRADTKRKEQIDALQTENLRLLRELESLSTKLKIEKAAEYKTLRQKRETLFDELEKNQNSIRMAFEKGTLLSLALKNRDELEEQKKNIDDALQFIADNTKFTIGKPEVRYKGNKADLLINVDWRIERIYEVLKKIESFYNSPQVVGKIIYLLYSHKFKGINAKDLENYCIKKDIRLYIRAGKWGDFAEIKKDNDIVTEATKTLIIKDIPVDELAGISGLDSEVTIYPKPY